GQFHERRSRAKTRSHAHRHTAHRQLLSIHSDTSRHEHRFGMNRLQTRQGNRSPTMIALETYETAEMTGVKMTSKTMRRQRRQSPESGPVQPSSVDENQWIERLKNGDEQALETFFNLYS